MNITSKVELITPDKAKEYLKCNSVNNRNISLKRVNTYAESMKNGAWQNNGESIVFNENGILINGQHRLSAIVKAGIPIEMVVIRGVSKDVSIFDRGVSRTTSQSLYMKGYDSQLANTLTCAVAKLHFLITNKYVTFVSDDMVEKFLLDHETNIRKAYVLCKKHSGGGESKVNRIQTSHACIAYAIFMALEAGENEEDLKNFTNILSTGFYENKNQTSAIVCRNDILCKAIDLNHTNNQMRIHNVMKIEKAIFDFCNKNPRYKTYKNYEGFTYKIKGE